MIYLPPANNRRVSPYCGLPLSFAVFHLQCRQSSTSIYCQANRRSQVPRRQTEVHSTLPHPPTPAPSFPDRHAPDPFAVLIGHHELSDMVDSFVFSSFCILSPDGRFDRRFVLRAQLLTGWARLWSKNGSHFRPIIESSHFNPLQARIFL